MRILVCLDGSADSRVALEYAVKFASAGEYERGEAFCVQNFYFIKCLRFFSIEVILFLVLCDAIDFL